MSDQELIDAATAVRAHAYAPYTHFDAGAAVRTESGAVVAGALVENISLGLAMCAERAAMFNAVAEGSRPVALALAAPGTGGGRTDPCGACLQVALELGGPDMLIISVAESGDHFEATVGALLPNGPYSGRKDG